MKNGAKRVNNFFTLIRGLAFVFILVCFVFSFAGQCGGHDFYWLRLKSMFCALFLLMIEFAFELAKAVSQ